MTPETVNQDIRRRTAPVSISGKAIFRPRRLGQILIQDTALIRWIVLVLTALLLARGTATAADHWAFKPVSSPRVPSVTRTHWPRTPVDHFILNRLEQAGRQPAPVADRRTLIRRATLDLTGLPPTPAEVDAFQSDPAPDAFARLIDRLLSSPRYGERWGRHWLDLARFADSNGMDENLAYGTAFRYRDYVVSAFNRDVPYPRFVQEQLAGDLLPAAAPDDDRSDQLIATGFLTLGPKMLAEDDPVKMEMDIVDEQLDSSCRVFMGLTVGCARCHDHKYDPVSTTDYYAMAGIFKSTRTMENFKVVARWQEVPLGPATAIGSWRLQKKAIEQQQSRVNGIVQQATDVLLADVRTHAAEYLLAATDRRDLARSLASAKTNQVPVQISPVAAASTVDGAAAQTASPPTLHPEFLTQWEKHLEKTASASNSIFSLWHQFTAEPATAGRQPDGGAPTNSSSVTPFGRLFQPPIPKSRRDLAERYRQIWMDSEHAWQRATNAPSARTNSGNSLRLDDPELEAFRDVLHSKSGPFAVPKNAESYFPSSQGTALSAARATLKDLEGKLPAMPEAMAVSDGTPTDLRVHKRGSHLNLGEEVPRGFTRSIGTQSSPAFRAGTSGRLQLAQWMTDPEHPLTARVIVNRIWRWHFGEGLVRSVDNFGNLGEKPTHAELLDWLARQFVETGGSIKSLHRLLMNSAAYQQSSSNPTDNHPGVTPDPENRLLSHFSRRRLEAEAIRDSILFVSGGLDARMGGTMLSVKNRTYVTSTASLIDVTLYDTPRRSLYLPVVRSALYDVFQVFDFADPSVLNGRRDQTVVAPQALFMMNSSLVANAARQMARSLLAASDRADSARVADLFRITFGRDPSAAESVAAVDYVARYQQKLNAMYPQPMDSRLKAWQSLCRTTLAANEFIHAD